MKKFFVFALSLLLLLTLVGCVSEEQMAAKPVIYLYPETETAVTIRLDYAGELTCTYPAISAEGTWAVTAAPDGTLTDKAGREYYCLFWEGTSHWDYDFSKGFCVPGTDTAAFLEEALGQLGLTEREANEFLIYWLPRMEQNSYNLIALVSGLHRSGPTHHHPRPKHGPAGVYGLEAFGCEDGPSTPKFECSPAQRVHPG